MREIEIRECQKNRAAICNDVLRSLPMWFGIESAIVNYVNAVEQMPMLVAYDGEWSIGFVSLKLHTKWAAEIYVMGIHPDFHRRGIGQGLIEATADYCKKLDVSYLTVKTLSPSRPNKAYEKTRHFYAAMGFCPIEEFKTLWDESNPCLLMIKKL